MTGQYFLVTVVDRNGKTREKIAAIGGGTFDADQLAQHYMRVDAFPGAKSVKIQDAESLPAGSFTQILNDRQGLAARLRPKPTPVPTVVTPEGEREARIPKPEGQPAPPAGGTGGSPAENESEGLAGESGPAAPPKPGKR